MTCETENNKYKSLLEDVIENGFDNMTGAVISLLNEAMKLDRSRHLQATSYERTEERNGYANGFKPKTVQTRLGKLELEVPQVRDSSSNFYPNSLEKGLRSEKALRCAIAEMYIQGVSTRRVKQITQELCGFDVSSSKVRHGGHVVDNAVLIAHGIDYEGNKRILGVSVSLSESEVHWRSFLESLVKRGLHGLKLIISDAHSGLKAGKRSVFPSVLWQRCQFHLQQNAQSYVPKQSLKKVVAKDIRDVFNAPSYVEAERLLSLAIEKYTKSAPKLSEWMEDNIKEGLTIFEFPNEHWKKLRTSNLAERVNKEIKRRTKVVGIFPNEASCLRLVSALLIEMDEDWIQGRRYLKEATI